MSADSNARHTAGPERQVRIGRSHTYFVAATNEGHVVRVLGSDGVLRRVSSETVRSAAIYAYRATVSKATGSAT